jgi:hypothetical protein
MGRLYDSLKQRGAGLPAASSVASSAPRLQVVPATADLVAAEDHEAMPAYEVGVHEHKLAHPAHASVGEPRLPKAKEQKKEAPKPQSKVTFAPQEDFRLPSHSISEQIVVVRQPDSADAKEYHQVAGHLSRLLTFHQARSLMLLPVEHAGSAPILTANLACAWAESTKHPIILVDAGRFTPEEGLAALLGLSAAPGWEELMTGTDLAQAIQQTGWAWLDAIAAGNRLSHSGMNAWAKKSGSILHTLGKHYESIILLGPAYPHSSLGIMLAEMTDSTCILVTEGQVNPHRSNAALHSLTNHGARVLGTIVMDK